MHMPRLRVVVALLAAASTGVVGLVHSAAATKSSRHFGSLAIPSANGRAWAGTSRPAPDPAQPQPATSGDGSTGAASGSTGGVRASLEAPGGGTATTAAPPTTSTSTSTTNTTAAAGGNSPVIGVSLPALVNQTPATQAAWLANLKSIGVNSIRIEADWAGISYAGPGTFDWSQLDQEVASIEAAGMSIDMVVMTTPSWAAVAGQSGSDLAQPADPAAFGSFAAAVAQRYAPQGVQDYEIWNEPNSTDFWLPAPNPAAYVQVLQAAYTDIKAVDPSAFVITGGLAPEANENGNIDEVTFLQDMYADGAQGYFDALGDHPYSYPALPDTYEEWSGWSKMDATPTSLRNVMTANGDGSKPIWITEVGAPTGGPDSVGTAGQAEELTQAIDNAKTTPWIGGLYIYTYEDSGGDPTTDEDWFGLLNADGSPKPAWSAVASAIG